MHELTRFVPAGFLALILAAPAWSAPLAPKDNTKEVEYKRADGSYYLRRDVLRADPDAVILPQATLRQAGASYFLRPRHRAPRELYLSEVRDWLEPITPPDMPASLGIAPDVMQIREMHGDVQMALPASPSAFAAATEGQTIPDGAIVKTGADGSAAVLFGGVNSARLAPSSQASVEQTITPELRSTRVDLKSGAVFSKVGLRPGEKQDYEVRTPEGTAMAKGTDFLTVAAADHADVFVAQGVVEFVGPDGKRLGEVKSTGKGELEVLQSSPGDAAAVTDELTLALDFIPTVNLKVKGLRDKVASGTKLTPQEDKYLGLLRRVPVLVKLAQVAPPPIVVAPVPKPVIHAAPPPPPPVAPLVTQVTLSSPKPKSPAPPAPVKPAPTSHAPASREESSRDAIDATLHANGTVDFGGATSLSPEEFQTALQVLLMTSPHETLVLRASHDVPAATLASMVDRAKKAGVQKVTVRRTESRKKEEAQAAPHPIMKASAIMAPRAESEVNLEKPAPPAAPPAKPIPPETPIASAPSTADAAAIAPIPPVNVDPLPQAHPGTVP
jgi:biopolymer transport protein ExbD